MQIVLGQMDYVGHLYLKQYESATRNQLNYNALYEQRTKNIDQKITKLEEGPEQSQENYYDPHDNHNKIKYQPKNKKRKRKRKTHKIEPHKGNIIDCLQ